MAGLHWFWRGALATVAGTVYALVGLTYLDDLYQLLAFCLGAGLRWLGITASGWDWPVLTIVPSSIVLAFAVFALLPECQQNPQHLGRAIVLKRIRTRWISTRGRFLIALPVYVGSLYVTIQAAVDLLRRFQFLDYPSFTFVVICFIALMLPYLLTRLLMSRLAWRWRDWDGSDCPNCGYSLTGNTSGVCPECGTAIP